MSLIRIIALLLCGALSWSASAQDARKVGEPVMPPACAVLIAALPDAAAGKQDDTARIQGAIDQCGAGKAVHLSASNDMRAFVSGPLTLRSGVTLAVDRDAILYAAADPALYDLGKGTCGAIDANGKGCREFIAVNDAKGSAIMGAGIIDGQGGHLMAGKPESWWDIARRAQKENANQNVPRLIQVRRSTDFILYGITLRNSPNFHVVLTQVDGFTAWGVKIDTPSTARNTDGIDPGSSRNITIAHSFIRTGDDNVAIKGGGSSTTENVSILHNHFYSGHGMSIGSETNAGVRNVLVDDLTMDGTTSGLRIKSDVSRGGLVSGVRYQNVCLREIKNVIELDTRYSKTATGASIPQFKDIGFQHVHSVSKGRVIVRGIDEQHALGVKFDDVVIAGPAQQQVEFAQIEGTISNSGGIDCTGRFIPFPEIAAPQTRPQLSAAQAAQYSYDEVLKYVGMAGKEKTDPWDPLADPLAANAALSPDYTVDARAKADGLTIFNTVQAAVSRAVKDSLLPGRAQRRVYVLVQPGVYHELLYVPAGAPVTVYSNDPDASRTRIRGNLDAGLPGADYVKAYGAQFIDAPPGIAAMYAELKDKPALITIGSPVLWVRNAGFQAKNLTFENFYNENPARPDCTDAVCKTMNIRPQIERGKHQAVAVFVDGADKVQFENVRFIGHQDTLYLRTPQWSNTVRSFFHKAYIEGDVDFIFGDTTAYFYRSEIKSMGGRAQMSYAVAPNTNIETRYGFVFNESKFTNDGTPNALAGKFHLARQWFHRSRCTPYGAMAVDGYACELAATEGYAAPRGTVTKTILETVGKVAILNSQIGVHINKAQPWADWNRNGGLSYRPVQYDSDTYWTNLLDARIDPVSRLGYVKQANRPFLAEFNNSFL